MTREAAAKGSVAPGGVAAGNGRMLMANDQLKLRKAVPEPLRSIGLDERWLQDQIKQDPSLLGLGEVQIIQSERTQPTGGRIDFLMSDPEAETRYEVEVMLGAVDESHIVRTIE